MLLIKTKLIKLSVFIVALQILNMSIECPNAAHDSYSTPTNYNYIDTYIEYVAEVIFKHEKAFPESGKSHPKHWQQHKLYQVICENTVAINNFTTFYQQVQNGFFNDHDKYAYQFIKDISPPPKFAC